MRNLKYIASEGCVQCICVHACMCVHVCVCVCVSIYATDEIKAVSVVLKATIDTTCIWVSCIIFMHVVH